jgi:REP element-mobilizing transposase RayT
VESGGLVCYGPSLIAMQRRLEFAGALYHLTARGNARADIFADDEDRRLFLELLGKEISQQRRRCYAYCLMDNHFHLLIETPEPNLVAGMRRLNGVYTQSFNRRHGRAGHVFQGRYQSIVVDKDSYGLELSRYAVLNPVRARRLKHPQNWPWSSYRATVGRVAACLRSCRDRILVVRDASRLARRPIAKKDLDICLHGSYHAFRCSYFKPMSWLKRPKRQNSQ